MRPEDILDAVGNADSVLVEKARKAKKSRKTAYAAVVTVAACLIVACVSPFLINLFGAAEDKKTAATSQTDREEIGRTEEATAYDDVWIYYVQDGQMCYEQEYTELTGQSVFALWREKNGVGDEVRLLEVSVTSNATTTVSEFQGMEVAEHTVGDYFIGNVTVSAEIETYYGRCGKELLLESLAKTMAKYGLKCDELYLHLSDGTQITETVPYTFPSSFGFSLTFGVNGESYYNSETGELIKTVNATHPEDYVTTMFLDEETLKKIARQSGMWDHFREFPDTYDPINDPSSDEKLMSDPSCTIILTVGEDEWSKTVTCPDVAIGAEGYDQQAKNFLAFCRMLTETVTSTEEWKSLPDYEFLYD